MYFYTLELENLKKKPVGGGGMVHGWLVRVFWMDG
jgi:hypothetical protein